MAVEESPVEFDPFSEVFFDDPYPMYRRLRDESPVYFNERYGFFALSRYDDVVVAHRDWQTYTSTKGVDLVSLRRGETAPSSIILMDPPEHHRMRLLVSRVFSPRAIAELEPMVRSTILEILDAVGDASSFDAVVDVAGPFPIEVISNILGIPKADRQTMRHLVDRMLHREMGSLELSENARDAGIEFGTYLYNLAQDKRQHPADDMLSRLCESSVERSGDEPEGLDDIEVAGFATLLAAAGAETVTKLFANAIVLFSRHPDQWSEILAEPQGIPTALEEVLRYWPPSQYQGRYSTVERAFEGGTIAAGYPVLLLTGAANRDEREFFEPDIFDAKRKPELALGFGHGIHTCLGAALARLESRIALEEWAKRYPHFEVDESGLRRVEMANVAGYSSVPLTATGAPAGMG